jgi:hypothetical protein
MVRLICQPNALYMQEEAEQQKWKVGPIASKAPTAALAIDGSERDKDSPYWWQFKQKVTAA